MCISVPSLLVERNLQCLYKSLVYLHLEYCIQFCSFRPISVKIELEEDSEMVNKDKGIEMEFQNSVLKL